VRLQRANLHEGDLLESSMHAGGSPMCLPQTP
jgi:hypothetical protein